MKKLLFLLLTLFGVSYTFAGTATVPTSCVVVGRAYAVATGQVAEVFCKNGQVYKLTSSGWVL